MLLADSRIPGGWVIIVTGVGSGANFAKCGKMLEVLRESGQVITWQVQDDHGAYHIKIAPPHSGDRRMLEGCNAWHVCSRSRCMQDVHAYVYTSQKAMHAYTGHQCSLCASGLYHADTIHGHGMCMHLVQASSHAEQL